MASGSADGNDAQSLRHAPVCKRSVERPPLEPAQALASAPTFARLAHSGDRKDLYRLTQALVEHFSARAPAPPAALGLDLDHADAPPHGPQAFAFSNHPYRSYGYVPLCMCEGTSHAVVTACLRPGTRPPGREKAMLLVRLLAVRRRHWPRPHILGRGDSHCATPAVCAGLAHRRGIDFLCGWAGNAGLLRPAAPIRQAARARYQQRTAHAQAQGARLPASSRGYEECAYAAASCSQPWRVLVQAEGMAAGDHPRFVGTSREAPTPQRVDAELYCARGHCENAIKAVQGDLQRDRPAATTFLANAMRLLLSCAAYLLHHALRTPTLAHPPLATAHPSTLILTLCTVAPQVKQYKDRMLLHLPPSWPVKALLGRVTALLSVVPVPALNTA